MIPPDIINEESSGDMMVPEGESIRLSCKAKGYPQPQIIWRREDGGEIILKDTSGAKEKGRWFYIVFIYPSVDVQIKIFA